MTAIRPFGEAALQVSLGDAGDPSTSARVHALARRVAVGRAGGQPWGTAVPGITTLLVPFDPRAWSPDDACERLATLVGDLPLVPDADPAATHVMRVRYGGADGPDLDGVAERLGLTPDQVVGLHAGTAYRVRILGFMPGFGYLGDLPEALRLARRATPRTQVPAGSVAIAGRHTGVYPSPTPGGWHVIGRTETRVWDPGGPHALLAPGDRVLFEPVG